jgi:RNA polymerase sigma factor (sigma-70 family)
MDKKQALRIAQTAVARWTALSPAVEELAEALAARSPESPPAFAGEDFALATAVAAGIAPAWGVFYEEFGAHIRQVAARHCRSAGDADEVCQDFLGDAPVKLVPYAGRCSLYGWLAAVVPNVARDFYRRREREVSLDEMSGDEDCGRIPPPLPGAANSHGAARAHPGSIIDRSRCREMLEGSLKAAWSRQDDDERVLLEYKFLRGMKSREIAAMILHIKEDVVSKRLRRALESLGRNLRRHALIHYKYDSDGVRHCVELVVGVTEFSLDAEV